MAFGLCERSVLVIQSGSCDCLLAAVRLDSTNLFLVFFFFNNRMLIVLILNLQIK